MVRAALDPMDNPRAQQLLEYINAYLAVGRDVPVTLDTPLLSDGLLDSLGVSLLATFMEEELGAPFDGSELRAGRLETVRALIARIGPT